MTTLREDVRDVLYDYKDGSLSVSEYVLDRIADLLSATGAPAYMRVAADLRGEVVERVPGVYEITTQVWPFVEEAK